MNLKLFDNYEIIMFGNMNMFEKLRYFVTVFSK